MTIQWSSLIAGDDGKIDYARLRGFTSVLLAMCGGGVTVAVTLTTLFSTTKHVDSITFGIMVSALVLPITGGKIADILTAKKANGSV